MLTIKTPENYIQEKGNSARVGEYVAPYGKKALIITGKQAWNSIASNIESSLASSKIQFEIEFYVGRCYLPKLELLAEKAKQFDVVIGVGGGSIMDATKVIAELADKPTIQVPTIAATCAAWSPFTVLYNESGGYQGSFPLTRYPKWILVDSEVIINAPIRFLTSGITDAIAKWYEFSPYHQTSNDTNLLLQLQVAKLTYDILAEHGEQAINDAKKHHISESFCLTVDACIALAGMANSVRDSLNRGGIAHTVHNSLTHLPELSKWIHGEKVGYGLAVQMILQYPNENERLPLLKWLRALSIPLTPNELSETMNDEKLMEIAERCKFKESSYQFMPFDISIEAIKKALLETKSLSTI